MQAITPRRELGLGHARLMIDKRYPIRCNQLQAKHSAQHYISTSVVRPSFAAQPHQIVATLQSQRIHLCTSHARQIYTVRTTSMHVDVKNEISLQCKQVIITCDWLKCV